MKVRILTVVSLVLVIAVIPLIVGCQPPTTDSTTTGSSGQDPVQAEALANEAIAAMKAGDYETALSKFSQAVSLDSTNPKAVIGYSTLNIAAVVTDPTLVSTMKVNMGLTSYPATIADVLNPDSWVDSSGNPVIPITDQTNYDGDPLGVIGFSDWGVSLAAFVVTHNTGLDFVPKTLNSALGSRVDAAIETIKSSVTDSMKFTITWDMIYDTQPTEGSGQWPYTTDHQPMEFVMGKAELLTLAAVLEEIRFTLHFISVYSLSLPQISDYWDAFGPYAATDAPNPTQKPFTTLLQFTSDAADELQAAKTSFAAGLSDVITAATSYISDRQGFSLSGDPTVGIFDGNMYDLSFADWAWGVGVGKRGAEEVLNSVNNNVDAYIVAHSIDPDTFNPSTDWPTGITPGQSVGINYGLMFSSPLALVGTTGLVELASSGEPQFYLLNAGSSASFSNISGTGEINSGSPNFRNDPTLAYLKVTDATGGGIVPTATLPIDNQSNVSGIKIINLVLSVDSNSNGKFDSGDTISSAVIQRSTSGVVRLTTIRQATDPSLEGYLKAGLAANTGNWGIQDLYTWCGDGNQSAFITALQSLLSSSPANFRVSSPGAVVLDNTVTPNALYIGIPEFYAWMSLATSGTYATRPDGKGVLSQGSLYWYLFRGEPTVVLN